MKLLFLLDKELYSSYTVVFLGVLLPEKLGSGVTETKTVKSFINQLVYNWYLWKAHTEAYKHVHKL